MNRRSFLMAVGGVSAARTTLGAEAAPGVIAFVQMDGLWTLSLPKGKPERLVASPNVESPRFSSSGKWIFYFRDQALFVVGRTGGQPIPLGKAIRGSVAPGAQWLPGRDELLVDDPAGLKSFTAANGWKPTARFLPQASLPVLISPDGAEMVYSDTIVREPGGTPVRTGRISRLPLDQPSSNHVALFSRNLSGQRPCFWSGDGESILFWEDPDFSASLAADGLDLYRVPATRGSPQPVGLTSLLYEDVLSPSPDRIRLAISDGAGREHWQGKRIATVHMKTWEIDYLTGKSVAGVTPSWSPIGDRIAYSAAPGPPPGANPGGGDRAKALLAKRRIWVAGASGLPAPMQLTDDDRYRDEKPMWSGDGTQILFCRIDAANDRTLWLMDAQNPSPLLVAGPLRGGEDWFGYYGYIDWGAMFDWRRGA